MKGCFRERLAEMIKAKGLSQKELAQLAGVTEAAMSHYVKGDRIPRASVLVRIAEALGTTADYLMNGNVPGADTLKNILDRHARNRHKEVIRLPHPECRSRPFLSGTARQKYANDEDCAFCF